MYRVYVDAARKTIDDLQGRNCAVSAVSTVCTSDVLVLHIRVYLRQVLGGGVAQTELWMFVS